MLEKAWGFEAACSRSVESIERMVSVWARRSLCLRPGAAMQPAVGVLRA